MIETVKITRVSATDKRKDGSKLTGKFGDYWRVGIQVEQYGDEWINGFMSSNPTWQEGEEVTLDIGEEEFNGQMQKKFRLPKKEDQLEERVKKLEDKVFGNDEPTDEPTAEPTDW